MASGGGKPLFATGVAALLGGLAVSRGGSRSLCCRPETARFAVLLSATVSAGLMRRRGSDEGTSGDVFTFRRQAAATTASRDSRVLGRTLPHTDSIHPIAMLAQKVSVSAKTTAVVKTPVAKRGATIVRRNSKGGEEGARDFGNTYVLFFLRGGAGRRG